MKRFHRTDDELARLEDRLRAERPQPRPELVHRLVAPLQRRPRRRTAPARWRLAGTAAVSAAMLVAFGSLGGIGYAASSTASLVTSVTRIAASSPSGRAGNAPARSSQSAGSDQHGGNGNGNGNGQGNGDNGNAGDGNGDNGNGGDNGDDGGGTPADDQYKPGKGCGDKNHVHFREGECKKLKHE